MDCENKIRAITLENGENKIDTIKIITDKHTRLQKNSGRANIVPIIDDEKKRSEGIDPTIRFDIEISQPEQVNQENLIFIIRL